MMAAPIRRKALTLVELMTSLAITSLLATVTTTVVVSMMHCREVMEAEADLARTGHISLSHVEKALKGALLVLRADANSVLLWTGDPKRSGRVNLTELAQIRYDAATETLWLDRLDFPANAGQSVVNAADTHYAVGEVVQWSSAESNPLRRSPFAASSPLAFNVVSARFTPDAAAPLSRCVTVELVCSDGPAQLTFQGAATLRSAVTDLISYDTDAGRYILLAVYDLDSAYR